MKASARAYANIAFIKYWGNRDETLRLPVNPSFSMNLQGLETQTTVTWRDDAAPDTLRLNGEMADAQALARVVRHLDVIRQRMNFTASADVVSHNNFPMGAGIASSAAAFAALTLAAVRAAEANLDERELTRLARRGSGSASRSVPSGFVVWHAADTDTDSYAESIAPPDYWPLVDLIAVVSREHKAVGSRQGHTAAPTSDLQDARVAGAQSRFATCTDAFMQRDFAYFAEVVEHDSNLMHAVMMTSRPPLFYWQPATLTLMNAVRVWRAEGLDVCYTLDAGPNVHCISTPEAAPEVQRRLAAVEGVRDVLRAEPGGPAVILD